MRRLLLRRVEHDLVQMLRTVYDTTVDSTTIVEELARTPGERRFLTRVVRLYEDSHRFRGSPITTREILSASTVRDLARKIWERISGKLG